MFSRRFPQAAFTLVEILVVVAVLAILVALAVPAVGRAVDRAATTADTNNLRQIGQGIAAYAAENDGRIPNARFSAKTGEESLTTGNHVDHSFMESVNRMVYTNFSPSSVYNWLDRPIWYSKRFAVRPPGANNQTIAWGMNIYLYYNASPLNNPLFNGVLRRAPNLSKLVLVGEKNDTGHEFNPRDLIPVTTNNVATRYRTSRDGKALYLFADYHIELIEGDQSVATNPTFNRYNPTNRLYYAW